MGPKTSVRVNGLKMVLYSSNCPVTHENKLAFGGDGLMNEFKTNMTVTALYAFIIQAECKALYNIYNLPKIHKIHRLTPRIPII